MKPEPIETIILDDPPPPTHIRPTTPATPSTLPNWLKRKAPIVKLEAQDEVAEPKKTEQTTTPKDSGATSTEGPAATPVANQTATTSATVPETKHQADPTTPAGTVELVTGEAQPGGDMEVEEVEPPTTEPGTLVFPQVRHDNAKDKAKLT